MNRVFLTGDKHRNFDSVEDFCSKMQTDKGDMMIVLGDNGVNWFDDAYDDQYKTFLSQMPITFMMIRGNHDMRPQDVKPHKDAETYSEVAVMDNLVDGFFLLQKEYPDLLFAIDGESYRFRNDISAFVIGGAHSVDKQYRLRNGLKWFPNEQLMPGEKRSISLKYTLWLNETSCKKRIVLTHTCPYSFVPREVMLPWPGKADEDFTMERWFDRLYKQGEGKIDEWYCGHWHTCKKDSNVRFMYDDFWRIV